MPTLVIVRHGQSTWNLENRFTGNVDVELTPLGEEEARNAGQRLTAFHFDKAYTSVLKRAIHSLKIILKAIGKTVPVTQTPALNERNYGDLQGLNKAEVELQYGAEQVNLWRRGFAIVPPNGESLKGTCDRVLPYYKKEIEPALKSGENVLIVAHGNSLRALMMYLENIGEVEISGVNLPTGIPRVYDLDFEGRVTKCYDLK